LSNNESKSQAVKQSLFHAFFGDYPVTTNYDWWASLNVQWSPGDDDERLTTTIFSFYTLL